MKLAKSLRSVGAVVLILALLVGMLSVMGTVSFGASVEEVTKFNANFQAGLDRSDLVWQNNQSANDQVLLSDPTVEGATDAVKASHDWLSARFNSYMNFHNYGQRSYFGQKCENGCYFTYGQRANRVSGRALVFQNAEPGGEVFWSINTLVPKHNGEEIVVENFEATVKFVMANSLSGGLLFAFHEEPAKYTFESNYTIRQNTGSVLAIGNNVDSKATYGQNGTSTDSWKFYADGTVEANYMTNVDKTFDANLNDQWYTLTVKAVNGTATFTITNAAGTAIATMDKAYTTTSGKISVGLTGREILINEIILTKLDKDGNPVDLGYTKEEDEYAGVNKFNGDFAELNNSGSFTGNSAKQTIAYNDPATDTSATNVANHNWLSTRFDSYANFHNVVQRSYFSQGDDDGGSPFVYGALNALGGMADAYRGLLFDNRSPGGELFWSINTLVPKYDGEAIMVKNFEATVKFAMTNDLSGGLLFAFHESAAGQYTFADSYATRKNTGSVLAIGNSVDTKAGYGAAGSSTDSWKFYADGKVEANYMTNVDKNFGANLRNQWYTLTVKAVNGTATFKLVSEDGTINETLTKTYSSISGGVSLGFSGREVMVREIKLVELDARGIPVDLGTYEAESAYDLANTVRYDFEQGAQLDAFDTWFVPTIHHNNAAIKTTGTSNTNWHIGDGKLRYKTSALYNAPAAYKSGVQLNGQNWLCSYASVYNSNMGIAVLKTKQYKNFILDFDFTGSSYWTTVGFGADNTADGVFWTTQNGGYNLFLEYDGGKGSSDFYYMTADGLKSERATGAFEYNASGSHHMRVIVTDNTAYMSVDDQPTWIVDVPSSYDGGYIFFALNNTTTAIDNVQVVDLDAKEIVITELVKSAETAEIDRAAGESLHFLETVYGLTSDGYQYPLLVDFESDDYRSYINGTFALNMKLKSLKNISFSDDFDGVLSVVNKVDYDTSTSRKYYFDHPNDFKDFGGYYSQPTTSNGYWSNANDTGSTTEKNRKWSAYDGNLVSIDPTQKWEINKGSASVNYMEDNGSASTVARMRNLSTLIYKGHTLTNFRMEYDVKKGSTWWYNYALIGVQDPTKYVYKLNKTSNSLSTGENAGTVKHDATKDAGVYAFLEQEGYFNIFGNTAGGNSDRVDADAVTVDGNAYEFIAKYDRNAWHHITIEVVNGVMKWTVDDSFAMYYELDYDAYGGYVGFGSYATGSQFDNFQITALNANGEAVDMSTAEQGGAKQKESITKPNAWVPSFKFSWN